MPLLIWGGVLAALLAFFVLGPLPYITGYYGRVNAFDVLLEIVFVYLPVFLFLSLITARPLFSAITALVLFVVWTSTGLIKNTYLGSTLVPADFSEVHELIFNEGFVVFKTFIPPLVLMTIALILAFRLAWRTSERHPAVRWPSALVLMVWLGLWGSGWYKTLITARFEPNIHNSLKQSVMHGFVNHFLHLLWTNNAIITPPGYSVDRIRAIIDKYGLDQAGPVPNNAPTSLITLIVESLTDPQEMGWQFDIDPIPNLHRLQASGTSGFVLSPVYGGKSVNAEFELLTGMSLAFMPAEAKPYRAFLPTSGIPALPDFLKHRGWRPIIGIQAVNIKIFFSRVFGILGFQKTSSVDDKHAPRAPNGMPTSQYLFAKIISLIKGLEANKPFYIHAFPNATHAPWHQRAGQPVHLLNPEGLTQHQVHTIENYAQALQKFDQALGELIKHLENTSQPVTLLIVGDHQPAILHYAKWRQQSLASQGITPETAEYLGKHVVPYLLWKNRRQENTGKQTGLAGSMNMLPALALKAMGVPPQGFMKLVAKVQKEAPFSSQIFFDGRTFTNKVPEKQKSLLADYRMLQYDLLHGKQYYYHFMEHARSIDH